jgi:acyl-CoA thioesterase I
MVERAWRVTRREVLRDCSLLLAALLSSGLALGQGLNRQQILVVGDSLSAEYGLAAGTGWVALLQAKLKQQKLPHQVRNASISGDTTAGGRSRLAALLREVKPGIVIIELGGNDALRGLPLKTTRDNLLAMTEAAQATGAKVLLVGMQVPPNYGPSYGREFAGLFAEVAKQRGAALVPFMLAGVADRADAMEWFQPDRIHPLAKAHPVMLETVWQGLKPLLR